MVARGNANRRMEHCGCTLRAMVAIAEDGDLQALVCTDSPAARQSICESCQQVCHRLNAALEARSFTHAAGLTPDHFHADASAYPQLTAALEALHQAMLEAILEFESKADAQPAYGLMTTDQVDRLAMIGV